MREPYLSDENSERAIPTFHSYILFQLHVEVVTSSSFALNSSFHSYRVQTSSDLLVLTLVQGIQFTLK